MSNLPEKVSNLVAGQNSETKFVCNINEMVGAPGRTRTCDLRIRSPLLYPAELRAPEARLNRRQDRPKRRVSPAYSPTETERLVAQLTAIVGISLLADVVGEIYWDSPRTIELRSLAPTIAAICCRSRSGQSTPVAASGRRSCDNTMHTWDG